jgi:hypothetical protein
MVNESVVVIERKVGAGKGKLTVVYLEITSFLGRFSFLTALATRVKISRIIKLPGCV